MTGSCPLTHPVSFFNGVLCCAAILDLLNETRKLAYSDSYFHCQENKTIVCPDLPGQVCEELTIRKKYTAKRLYWDLSIRFSNMLPSYVVLMATYFAVWQITLVSRIDDTRLSQADIIDVSTLLTK